LFIPLLQGLCVASDYNFAGPPVLTTSNCGSGTVFNVQGLCVTWRSDVIFSPSAIGGTCGASPNLLNIQVRAGPHPGVAPTHAARHAHINAGC